MRGSKNLLLKDNKKPRTLLYPFPVVSTKNHTSLVHKIRLSKNKYIVKYIYYDRVKVKNTLIIKNGNDPL